MTYVDATCPLVSKVHREAENLNKAGYHIILIGHENHPEVIGTMGQLKEGSIDLIQNVDQPGIAETSGMGMHLLQERPMDRVRRDPKPRRPPRFSSHRHTRGTWARTHNSPATTNDTRAASQLASPGSSWPSCPSVCCSHQRRTCPAAASACPGTTLPRAGSMSASQAAVRSTTSTALE